MIATKQFQVGELLPSTRVLAKQLGASFHTVRKAYQLLTDEGLLKAEGGRGFKVHLQTVQLDKSARLEKGAEKVRVLLEELIGYGLDEDEIETVFEEQLNFLELPERRESVATVMPTRELAAMLARALRRQVGLKTTILTTRDFDKAINFDALCVPVAYWRAFRREAESAVLIPLVYGFDAGVLTSVVERSAVSSIGILATEDASLPILVEEMKAALRYEGSIWASSVGGRSLPGFLNEVDLVLYTWEARNVVEKALPEGRRLLLQYQISETSCDVVRDALWEQ